jgi:hypothetical protein
MHNGMPRTSSANAAIYAARDLIDALRHPAPAALFATLGNAQLDGINQLTSIFAEALPMPPATSSETSPLLRVNALPASQPDGWMIDEIMEDQYKAKYSHLSSIPFGFNRGAPGESPLSPPRVPPVAPAPCYPRRTTQSSTPSPMPRYPLRNCQSQHNANYIVTITSDWTAMSQPTTPPLGPEFANAIFDHKSGKSLEYGHLLKLDKYKAIWTKSFTNELGRLARGVADQDKGTNTIFFICNNQVPRGHTVTYGRIVCKLRPHKSKVHRTRLTVGGNLIDYPGNISTKTAGLTTAKLLFNSIVSTHKARLMGIDVKNFYLNTRGSQST